MVTFLRVGWSEVAPDIASSAGRKKKRSWEHAAKEVDNDPNEAGSWRLRSATTS